MGRTPDLQSKFSKGAVIQFLYLPEGRKIISVGNWEQIYSDPDVKLAMLNGVVDKTVPFITDSSKRMGFVIVQCSSRNKAVKKADRLSLQLCNQVLIN
jgi:hypothetical protein